MAASTISSRLIGRDDELATLVEAVRDADACRPTLAFVAGESGVGKSRLLSELARQAREDGARVLSGECVELGDGELPYAPLVGALRPLVRAEDPALLELPASARHELAALLPGLANADGADGGVGGTGTAHQRSESDGQAQSRLFEALLAASTASAVTRRSS